MDRSTVMGCGKTLKVIATSVSGFLIQLMDMEYMNGVTVTGMRVSGDIR